MSLLDQSTLPNIIRDHVKKYAKRGITSDEINGGWCEEFSSDVLTTWVGDDYIFQDGNGFQEVETANFILRDGNLVIDWDWILLEKSWNILPPTGVDRRKLKLLAWREPNHIWITTQGKHYDSESPDGVASFFDLKFFKRWLS